MSGNAETGKKAAITTKQRFGADAFQKWGSAGRKVRKSNPLPFKDNPTLASEAGIKGGALGYRCRKITPSDNLRDDEWAVLLKLANRAAGVLRLSGDERMDAMEQHSVYYRIFEFWEKQDWVGAMTKAGSFCEFNRQLYTEIVKEYLDYTQKVKGQPRRSPDRNHLRVVRNIKAAFESLGDKINECPPKNQ